MRPSTHDAWIETPRGRLLARTWLPQDPGSGAKPPIVLFHDSLGCIQLWRTFPAALAEGAGRRVIAYDRLGFGQSGRRHDTLDSGFIREEAERFFPRVREQLGFDRFVAFGHSVGGGMAAHCAALLAPACAALVTESAQAFMEDRTREGILEAKAQFSHREAFGRLERYHGERTRWVLDAWIETWLSPAFEAWTLDILPQVRCPALVLHGSEDEYGSELHPRRIAGGVAGPSQLEIMPGVKHMPHREEEAWVVRRVAGFLEGIQETAPQRT